MTMHTFKKRTVLDDIVHMIKIHGVLTHEELALKTGNCTRAITNAINKDAGERLRYYGTVNNQNAWILNEAK